ncbi:hypothetical protein INS49_015033 [Diaporthe citri]|uniref:uncharacterized protein n=1 Tax=Diaporthe citri TaxID=83186 RepID=UPI001C82669A|nr:uncharacterized protein INS49_015033 [Diaporthe citri]KAG6357156.1 hypothetical protein INS49_015033 [Diaporthe citri]
MDQGVTFKPPAATQWEPSEFPQVLEFLGDAFGDSPSTSSVGPSLDTDTESYLFASIVEYCRQNPRIPSKTSFRRSKRVQMERLSPFRDLAPGLPSSTAHKKQKTCTPSDADGDAEDGSGSNGDAGDDGSGDGEDGDDKSSDGDGDTETETLPYQIQSGRDRIHLRRFYSPEDRLRNVQKNLAQYYMSAQQWKEVKEVMENINRPQRKKYPQVWLQVQRTWYQEVWAILFPLGQYVPDSPFYMSNEALKERCHHIVEAMMDLECERAQARDCPSRENTQFFTRLQVQETLDKALLVGLDSLPIVAQQSERCRSDHTGRRTAGPTPGGFDGITPNTEAAAAETEESSTPENTLSMIPKAVTPQPLPFQIALDAQQTLQKSSDVPLENNGQSTFISIELNREIRFKQLSRHQWPGCKLRLCSVKIEDPRDWYFGDIVFEGLEGRGAARET